MNESEILAAARQVAQCLGVGPRGHAIPGGGGKFTRLACSRGDLFISYVSRDDAGETVTVEWRGSTVFERDGASPPGIRNPDRTAPDGEWTAALASAQADASRAMESAAQKAESDGRGAGGIRASKLRGAWGLSAADGRQRGGEDPSGPRIGGVMEGRP
jgi:hypothetical protein